jgi:hypothetical protein
METIVQTGPETILLAALPWIGVFLAVILVIRLWKRVA